MVLESPARSTGWRRFLEMECVLKPDARVFSAVASKALAKTDSVIEDDDYEDFPCYASGEGPSLEPMQSYLGYRVRRLYNQIADSFQAELGDEDITPARYTALTIIAYNPGVRQVDIARVLEVARPAALKVVNHLIAQGLVEVKSLAHDKRAGALILSEYGRERFAQYEQAVRRHEANVFSPLSPTEREQLAAMLSKLTDGVR